MNLFIKLLVFSFPFVFAGALFWPAIEDKFQLFPPTVEQSEQADFLAVPEKPKKTEITAALPTKRPIRATDSTIRKAPSSGIYRSVNDKGNVVFSDRPLSKKAAPHTPKEIGYVEVSQEWKQSLSEQLRSIRREQNHLINQTTSKKYRTAGSVQKTEYEFERASAVQKFGYVSLTGRISGGSECEKLVVYVTAKSDIGEMVRGRDVTSYNGFGSTLYDMKPDSSWHGSGRRPRWDVIRASARCSAF